VSGDVADHDITIGEIATLQQWADEQGFSYAGARHYALKWPDACVSLGGHTFIVRARMQPRLANIDFRPAFPTKAPIQPLTRGGGGRQ
jgi:hypothetical protein